MQFASKYKLGETFERSLFRLLTPTLSQHQRQRLQALLLDPCLRFA